VPGGDDIWFRLPEAAPDACALALYARWRESEAGPERVSNSVTIPVSKDGGPCGDSHGFNSSEVRRLTVNVGYTVASTVFSEVFSDQGGQTRTLLRADFSADRYNAASYDPPQPLGTCKTRWFPADATNPFAPVRLPLEGPYQLQLPNTTIPLGPNSNLGPYSNLFGAAPSPFRAGSYSVLFPRIGGAAVPNTTGAQYQRLAGAGLESVMSRVEWDPNRNICLPQLMIGLTAATLSGDLYAVYDRIYNYGPHGTERIRCYLPADPAQLAAVRSSVLQPLQLGDAGRNAGGKSSDHRHSRTTVDREHHHELPAHPVRGER